MSGIEILTTTLFSSLLESTVNIIFDFKYDLYGYFNKGVDLGGFIYVLGIFPAVNIVFLNLFPFKRSLASKVTYLFCWSVLAVIFELLYLRTKTFYYNGWKISYSMVAYPILYIILVCFYKYAHYLLKKSSK
ncbi:CBO0543 family protein [Pullulanibacillus sp. KACC 23026]|uniref:CBO0543 family protein n=1 Tax=Pullulanibacillus sp. KACC 23026 TaxID=3028315 RepID=UPI0031B62D9A